MADLINPIIVHGPGACRECHTNLIVADREINTMLLNDDGSVSDYFETHITCAAMCPKCGAKYPMMRFMGTYRPVSQYLLDIAEIELRSIVAKDRPIGKYNIDGNPLAIENLEG